MPLRSFVNEVKIHPFNSGTTEGVLAGAFSCTSNPVCMEGFSSICVVANIAKTVTTTSGANLSLMYSCSSGGTFHPIAGTAVQCGSSDTNFFLASELDNVLPEQKWMAATVAVPATCSWVGAVNGFLFNPRVTPVTQPTCCYTDINVSATSGTI